MNRDNLLKLADYLETLPRRYKEFDMQRFFDGNDSEREAHYALHNGGVASCGTSACAVGHGPSAGIFVDKRHVEKSVTHYGNVRYSVDWQAYTRKNFVGTGRSEGHLFEWMFGGDWSRVDNHHWGAAARIRYVLAGGEVEKNFESYDAKRSHRALYRAYDKRYPA